MEKLKIRKIMMIGDSLTHAHAVSLYNLEGSLRGMEKNGDFVLDGCPNNPRIEVRVRRMNVGANFRPATQNYTLAERQQYGPEELYCSNEKTMEPDEYCPWQLEYKNLTSQENKNDDNERILLILNQGAHFHSLRTFRDSFDNFVEKFNSIAEPNDIVVFRSTVPGHIDCLESDGTVGIENMTYEKFLQRYSTTLYDWNLFELYNQYVKEAMARNLTSSVKSMYLNVYNMTVLRFDAHVSSTDCLHYMPPGPIDFWNHLLISNLADLAKNELLEE